MLGLLSACGGDIDSAPSQNWQGVNVQIESRPSPPQVGMNEFLIMATNQRGQPVYDLIVSIRTSNQDPWVQAIEDGQMGVYRRAAEVGPGERSTMQVQIMRDGVKSELRFPLKVEQ